MKEPMPEKKRGFTDVVMIVVAAALIISPAYVGGYLLSHGKLSISYVALVSLAMFLVGALLIVKLLRE
jgi:purine-cytosine permease-like protein